MLFLACPVEPTGYVKILQEKKSINAETMFLMSKPFTQNAYFAHFLEGHQSALRSRLANESRIFKIITGLTFIKHFSKLYGGTGFSPFPLHLVFLNEQSNVTLCDWFSVLCIKLCLFYFYLTFI